MLFEVIDADIPGVKNRELGIVLLTAFVISGMHYFCLHKHGSFLVTIKICDVGGGAYRIPQMSFLGCY